MERKARARSYWACGPWVRRWIGFEVLCGAIGGFEQDDVVSPGEGCAEQPGSQR